MIAYLRKDDEGIWYLIPGLFIIEFDELSDKLEGLEYLDSPYLFDDFEDFFGKYRIDNIYNIKCIMDNEL